MASSERAEAATSATATSTPATPTPATSTPATSSEAEGAFDQGGSGKRLSRPAASAEALNAARISCLMNAQYHSGREAYLDTVHRWFMFIVIALGAGAMADLLPKGDDLTLGGLSIGLKELFAASAAVIAALDLTFDLSNRARVHSMQKRRYFELLAQLNEGEKSPEQVRVCIDEFSADEEPAFRVMIFSCWNSAQVTIYGRDAHQIDIPWYANWFKNWFRMSSASYDLKK